MHKITPLHGFNAYDPKPTVAFRDHRTATLGTATFAFTAVTLGREESGRIIIVGLHGQDSATAFSATGVTVNGSAATKRIGQTSNNGLNEVSLWTVPLSTATSATISVVWSEVVSGCHMAVWAAYNLNSAVPTATDGDIGPASTTVTSSCAVQVLSDGIVVGIQGSSATWVAPMSQTFAVIGAEIRSTGAVADKLIGTATFTIQATDTGIVFVPMVVASWR